MHLVSEILTQVIKLENSPITIAHTFSLRMGHFNPRAITDLNTSFKHITNINSLYRCAQNH